ncbi:MAG TPA: hypothetical protein VGC47_00455 [Acidimicrobiia bacterium]
MSSKLSVLDPTGYPPTITARGLAPALDSLDDKTVFLVDIGWENCDVFAHQLEGWFSEHLPKTETRVVKWRDQHQPDPELSDQIRTEGDAAILGVGL